MLVVSTDIKQEKIEVRHVKHVLTLRRATSETSTVGIGGGAYAPPRDIGIG